MPGSRRTSLRSSASAWPGSRSAPSSSAGRDGPAASSIEVGWSLGSVLRGRVGRVRIDGLTVNATIEQGEFVIVGLPRGDDSGGGMVALPVEQIELNGATRP